MAVLLNSYRFAASGGGTTTWYADTMARGPVRYYRLGETSGTVANDSSGNGQHGTYVTSPTLGVTGAIVGDTDKAVHFAASAGAQRVDLPTTGLPSGSSPYTLEILARPSLIDNNQSMISLGAYGTTRAANTFRMGGSTSSPVLVNYWWGADLSVPAPALNTTAWHHLIATWDGTTRTIFHNKTLLGSDTPGAPNIAIATPTIAKGYGTEYFTGDLDEAIVWNFAFTQAIVDARFALTGL